MRILCIETTCDETAVSIVEFQEESSSNWGEFRVLSEKVKSQVELHRVFGGVVPEIASRKHQETLLPLLSLAFQESGISPSEIDLIGVSAFPGLIGAVLIGVSAAKSFALASGKPFVGVNHLWGHIYAAFLQREPQFPLMGLVISGGHTNLYLFEGHLKVKLLGRTLDDALGEAFDKVARLLGLGYPGGPLIDKLAKEVPRTEETSLKFPIAMRGGDDLNFSYSGLKTAVNRLIKKLSPEELERRKPEIAKAFQEAAIEQVIRKLKLAIKLTGVKRVVVGGGVSANSLLREKLKELSERRGVEVHLPPLRHCVDNATMLAPLCYVQYKLLGPSSDYLEGYPSEEEGLKAIGLRLG